MARNKKSKAEVHYEHPAKGHERCGICSHFIPLLRRCQVVEGLVAAEDWCNQFTPKPPGKRAA